MRQLRHPHCTPNSDAAHARHAEPARRADTRAERRRGLPVPRDRRMDMGEHVLQSLDPSAKHMQLFYKNGSPRWKKKCHADRKVRNWLFNDELAV